MFEGEHGKLLPGGSIFFFPFPAPCGHSWLQNWIRGDTSEVEFFEFRADCIIKKEPLGVGILGQKVGRIDLVAVGLSAFRKMKEVKVSCIHAKYEENIWQKSGCVYWIFHDQVTRHRIVFVHTTNGIIRLQKSDIERNSGAHLNPLYDTLAPDVPTSEREADLSAP